MNRTITKFSGGISPHSKSGLDGAFRFSKHLDIFSDGDSVTLHPKTVKESGSVVVGLVRHMVSAFPYNSNKWAYDDLGNIYSIDSNVWTNRHTAVSAGDGGQGLLALLENLYYATSETLGRGRVLSAAAGSVTFNDDFLSDGFFNNDLSVTASGQTYTVPTSITETDVNSLYFTPTTDPLKIFEVYVTARGTGNWTITIHDENNTTLGTVTIANASLNNGAMNAFTFTTQIPIDIGKEYHAHITSTVADGTVQTGTTADLSTAQYKTYFGILINDDDFHEMVQFTNGVAGTVIIGNGGYLAELVPGVSYSPNRIRIEPGYKIRGLIKENNYIVAYAWKGDNIDDTEDGKLYYWDGISPYYNDSRPVTGGAPNALCNYKNRVFSAIGARPVFTLGTEPFLTLQGVPNLARGETMEILPSAVNVWRNRAHVGVGIFSTDESDLIQGVYEFGNQTDRATSTSDVSTEVLNFAYSVSTGETGGEFFAIGGVFPFGNELYISWDSADGTTHGVDRVAIDGDPFATGRYESLIDDYDVNGNHAPNKDKAALKLTIVCNQLPTGCTLTPIYRINRNTTAGDDGDGWIRGTAAVAGATTAEVLINSRYKEIEYGFIVTATTNYPQITAMDFEMDTLKDEDHGN